jgi:hypothetical protein
MIGTEWTHFKREGTYRIVGFTFDGERDLWCYRLYKNGWPAHMEFCRSIENFHSEHSSGVPRFTRIDDTRTWERYLEYGINYHCMENGSNTPDFILGRFLANVLRAFDQAAQERGNWTAPPEDLDDKG